MNKFVVLAAGTLLSFTLVGCQNKAQSGTLIGAGAGAIAGNVIGGAIGGRGGRVLGTLLGAAAGGAVGHTVGAEMDAADRAKMQRAIATTQVGYAAQWHNPRTGADYQVVPVKNYHREGRYCREYQTKVTVGGKKQSAYGRACRQPDGSWKIVS